MVAGEFKILDHSARQRGEERVVNPRHSQANGVGAAGTKPLRKKIRRIVDSFRLRLNYFNRFLTDSGALRLA